MLSIIIQMQINYKSYPKSNKINTFEQKIGKCHIAIHRNLNQFDAVSWIQHSLRNFPIF